MKKNICAYVRLSNEDIGNNSTKSSASINNQIDLIKKYAQKNDLMIHKIYIDDGYSGGNFDRPNFKNMIQDIENNEISTIIVKDLSRLGREMFDTYYYISEYFPKMDVRFIAINDNFDSFHSDNMFSDILLGFKALYNDRYIKQTSIKIKNIKKLKSEQGNFISFMAPYGYKKVRKNGITTLEIDDIPARIIKRIFEEIISGKKVSEIANELNDENVIHPAEYLKMTRSKGKDYIEKWNYGCVYRIVRNVVYTGNLYYRQSIKKDYRLQKRKFINRNDRDIIKNTHPAIIDEKTFLLANEKVKKVKKSGNRVNFYQGFFQGLVYCGECGKQMLIASRKRESGNRYFYFYCPNGYNKNQNKFCTNKRKKSDLVLKEYVCTTIDDMINHTIKEEKIIDHVYMSIKDDINISNEIVRIKKELDRLKSNVGKLYIQKVKGTISAEEFLLKKEDTYLKIEDCESRLNELSNIQASKIKKEELIEKYKVFIKSDDMYKMAIEDLVEKIDIYQNNEIVIKFKFSLNEDITINN